MTDFASAKARAQKIVANPKAYNRDNLALVVAFLELEHLVLKYFTAEQKEQENHHKALSAAYSQKEQREFHRLAPIFVNTTRAAEQALREFLGA
jgi:hypothetical protein